MLQQKAVFSIWSESWEHVKNKWDWEIKQDYGICILVQM